MVSSRIFTNNYIEMLLKIIFSVCTVSCICASTEAEPNQFRNSQAAHSQGKSSTSPTISVQRYGDSTFYNYVQDVTTEATTVLSSIMDLIPSGIHDLHTREEKATAVAYSASNSNSGSGQLEERALDDASAASTQSVPIQSSGNQVDDSNNDATVVPVISGDSPATGSDSAVPSPDASDGSTGNQQPPAEAVPGQPSDADADSSSSEESSSSSSSEEDFDFKAHEDANKLSIGKKRKVHVSPEPIPYRLKHGQFVVTEQPRRMLFNKQHPHPVSRKYMIPNGLN